MPRKKNLPEVVVWGTGKPVREWLYVDDGAEALIRALDINYYVDPINIGIGRGISIKYLAQLIKRIVGYKGKLIFDKTNAVYLTGATPVFVDVKIDDLNIDSSKIEKAMTKKTKAIMPVHIYGAACDMDKITQIA